METKIAKKAITIDKVECKEAPKENGQKYSLVLTIPITKKNARALQLWKFGYIEDEGSFLLNNFKVTITGGRKIKKAIASLLSEVSEDVKEQDPIAKQLINFDSQIPAKENYSFAQGSVLDSDYVKIKNNPLKNAKATHSVRVVEEKNVPNGYIEKYVLKKMPTGRKIAEIEAFESQCHRLLLDKQTPKIKSTHNEKGERIGTIAEYIPELQTFLDCLKSPDYSKFIEQNHLVDKGIGRLLAAAYTEEDNDKNWTNAGFDAEGNLYGFDYDQASYPLTAKYQGFDPSKKHTSFFIPVAPKDAHPILQEDLNHFPHLAQLDAHNQMRLERGIKLVVLSKKLSPPDLFNQIEQNSKFINDVFITFLKRTLIDKSVYKAIGESTISSQKTRDEFVRHKVKRGQVLKAELLKNAKFREFLQDNHKDVLETIITDFSKYNADCDEASQHVNIEAIKKNFNDTLRAIENIPSFIPVLQNKVSNKPVQVSQNDEVLSQNYIKDLQQKITDVHNNAQLSSKQKEVLDSLVTALQSTKDEKGNTQLVAQKTIALLDNYAKTKGIINGLRTTKSESEEALTSYKRETEAYKEYVAELYPSKKIIMLACMAAGALLGSLAFTVLGIAGGAFIGGGAGSVVPVLGNVFGAGVGGIIGAVAAAGTGVKVGVEIGAVAGMIIGGFFGYKASRYTLPTPRKVSNKVADILQEEIKPVAKLKL